TGKPRSLLYITQPKRNPRPQTTTPNSKILNPVAPPNRTERKSGKTRLASLADPIDGMASIRRNDTSQSLWRRQFMISPYLFVEFWAILQPLDGREKTLHSTIELGWHKSKISPFNRSIPTGLSGRILRGKWEGEAQGFARKLLWLSCLGCVGQIHLFGDDTDAIRSGVPDDIHSVHDGAIVQVVIGRIENRFIIPVRKNVMQPKW